MASNDNAEIAARLLDAEPGMYDQDRIREAQVHATLALVDEVRLVGIVLADMLKLASRR